MATPTHTSTVYAAVEFGSDSFRLHVASVERQAVHIHATLNEPIRLGAAVGADGCVGPETMRRALACLRGFKSSLAPWEPRAVRVVATSALRVAFDTPAFLAAACAAIGHPIEVIGGEEEGGLVYLGVAAALAGPDQRRLVLDIGTGSTEVAVGQGMQVGFVQSFGVGALRQGLAFFGDGISPGAFEAALASSRSRVADAAALAGGHGWARAYGASGTVRALAELADVAVPGTTVLDGARLAALRRALVDEGGLARAAVHWPQPARAAQLAGGLALLLALVDELGISELVPVQAGLRAGVIRDLHRRAEQGQMPG
ncbi:MAG: exopolyphosphatase / guanosine-5-triphosphate,3-diphosphate pyrophosphatase [Massilia sp.]|jgi:exopolyphosphatase/guanosine-5'-triphosphate,3'-diphosphate pyrophosphatase